MLTTRPPEQYEAPAMAEPLFTAEEQKKFDAGIAEILSHYPPDRKSAGMLPALRLLQTLKGWLPPDGMRLVAKHLEVTPERAYEVASFYVMYHLKKPGKYTIDVCTNLSCALWGAEKMLAYLEDKLGLKAGEANESSPCGRPSAWPPAARRRAFRLMKSTTRA
jgi:NADH-quinone oxidoreductase subunit E